ncbi:MAG: ABC transporter permease, partial [Nitrospirota bacterium]
MIRQGFWLQSISGLGIAFLYLPIIVLVVFSFNASRLSAMWQGFSWHWYGVLWHDEALLAAAANSLWVAALSTSFVVLLGVPAAMGLERLRGRGRQ